ncbi:MAG: putative Ig domain-containing protein [Gemmataceae bacterium]|nr:putative Ig domain-containing protein [Gemmataceae bacterium]
MPRLALPRRLGAFTRFDRLFALHARLADLARRAWGRRRLLSDRLGVEALEERVVPDGRPLPYPVIYAGAGQGPPPLVRAFDAETGALNFERLAADPAFAGGVRVATADFTLDGFPDLVTALGPGGEPRVRVLDGKTGDPVPGPLGDLLAYAPDFAGGVQVAAADADGDGVPEVITAAGAGGGPHVQVFDGRTGQLVRSFFAFEEDFRGGATVAAADFDGDGRADLAVGAGAGGGPRVRVFDLATGEQLSGPLGNFFASDPESRAGVAVGADWKAGDVDADGTPDLAVGSGPGEESRVRVFSGRTGDVLLDFAPFAAGTTAGVVVALAYVDDDPFADVVAGTGPGVVATVRVFSGVTGLPVALPTAEFFPFGPDATGGVNLAASNDPTPAPQPVATLSAPAEALLGETFTFTATFDNTSATDTGYGPAVELTLPASGADGAAAGTADDDGITFVSASAYGITMTPSATTYDAAGNQVVTLPLPFHGFTPGQPAAAVTVTAQVSNRADPGTNLTVKARGLFRYGADPLDNPGPDPQVAQGGTGYATAAVAPALYTLAQTYLGTDDETATGPNFPRQYKVTANVAAGLALTSLDLTNVLPTNLQYVGVDATTVAGSPVATTAVATPPATPGGTLTRRFAGFTGTAGANDAELTYTLYAPRLNDSGGNVLNPATGAAATANLNAKGSAAWAPVDTRDGASAVVPSDRLAVDHALTLRSVAARHVVAVVPPDAGSAGPTPGDVLEHTVTAQVSDYYALDQAVVTDTVPDGQRLDLSFAPTLEVDGNGFFLAAAGFAPANYTVTPKYSSPPDGKLDGTDGTTLLDFRVSNEMAARGKGDRLLGGLVDPAGSATFLAPPGGGPTTVTVRYRTVVQEGYSDAYGPPNPAVKQGDPLGAVSGFGSTPPQAKGRLLNPATFVPVSPAAFPADTHLAAASVPRGDLAVAVYAVNGSTTLPAAVKAQDAVTYRLTYTLRTGDVGALNLSAFLPPAFVPAGFTYTHAAGGIPAAGAARPGPADTFLANFPAVTPTLTVDGTNNALRFAYGSLSDPLDRATVVDLLFTVQVTAAPFPDRTPLTVLGYSEEANSSGALGAVARVASVPLAEPRLAITKGAVSTDNPRGVFSRAVGPAGVTWGSPGSATPFTGRVDSPGLAAAPVDADLERVDSLDRVRFAVVVENAGSGPRGAFDVVVKDVMPAGLVVPAGGLNLTVTDGTGAALPYTALSGGLFGSGLQLNDPSASAGALARGRDDAGNPINSGGLLGKNVLVVAYDLQVADPAAAADYVGTATVVNYAAVEGGPNFVTQPLQDAARVSVNPWVQVLLTGSGLPSTAGAELAVGETAAFQVTLTLPEGTTPNAVLTDLVGPGMAVVSLDALTPSGAAVTTSVAGGFPAVLAAARAALAGPGGQAVLNLGTLTDTDRNNAAAETLTLTLTAVVLNTAANQDRTGLTNQATVGYATGLSRSASAAVTVAEPRLTLALTPSLTAADALTQSITYTLDIAHAADSASDAFDLEVTDILPAGLVYEPGSFAHGGGITPVPNPPAAVGATLRATYPRLDRGQTARLTFRAKLAAWAEPGQAVSTAARLTYTSLPGDKTTPLSAYNPVATERTGDPGNPGGAANDYAVTSAPAVVAVHSSTLSGFVYHDANGNNAKTTGEPGLQGVVLTLTGTDHLGAAVSRTTATDFAGAYSFAGLRWGTYTVAEAQPPGWADGLDKVGTPALGAGATVNDQLGPFAVPAGASTASVNNNFGEASVALGGRVFVDANWNGAFDAGEAGITGVSVALKNAAGATVQTKTSAADGTYSFGTVTPARYTVEETPPAGYGSTTPAVVSVNLLSAAGPSAADFGHTPTGLAGWATGERGGSDPGRGTAAASGGGVVLVEGNSFQVFAEKAFAVPARPGVLRLSYSLLSFDTTSTGTVKDAFEVAVVDPATGRVLVAPYRTDRETAYNLTEGLPAAAGRGSSGPASAAGAVSLDLSGLTPGAPAKLVARLVNNDRDNTTQVRLDRVDLGVTDPPKFFVVDDAADAAFRYDAGGVPLGNTALQGTGGGPAAPRGAAAKADGTRVWVADAASTVWAYDGAGAVVWGWRATASGAPLADPQGVATDGTDVWLVDAAAGRVYRYSGGATTTATTAAANSSFPLDPANARPTDLVTDGTTVWVTDGGAAEVFVYSTAGALQGRWKLDPANADPSGVTVNPGGGTELWVVDRQDRAVYSYPAGRSATSGGLTATSTFPLSAGATRPEGIADPPVGGGGTDFWLTVPEHQTAGLYLPTSTPNTVTLRLYIAGETATTGLVSVPGVAALPFAVNPGRVTAVNLPLSALLGATNDATYPGRGVHVTAGADVVVTALDRENFNADSLNALPTQQLGTDYILLGYHSKNSGALGSRFVVLATEDGTEVTVTPTVYRGAAAPGTPFTVTLNRGDAYFLSNNTYRSEPPGVMPYGLGALNANDVTGTAVRATKPVAVYGSHKSTGVPSVFPAEDHLLEQVPPVPAWGTRYFTVPLNTYGGGTYRVVASAANTVVTVKTYPTGGGVQTETFTIPMRGGFYEFIRDPGTLEISGSAPILVGQYCNNKSLTYFLRDANGVTVGEFSENSSYQGDPFMTLVPAVTQFAGRYAVAVPPYYPDAGGAFAEGEPANYLSVVVAAADQGSLRLNGQPITGATSFTFGSTGYVGLRVPVPAGTLQALTSTTGAAFGVTVYGYKDYESYGHLGGATFPTTGPQIAVESPAAGCTFPADQAVLVTGRATPGQSGSPIVRVLVDGRPVEAVDGAGRFFARVAVRAGQNSFRLTAVDRAGEVATAVLPLAGVAPPAGVDASALADVAAFTPEYARTSFDEAADVLYADLALRNAGNTTWAAPLVLTVEDLSDPQVRLRDFDGRLPDGTPYYDFGGLVAGGRLAPGAATGVKTLAFLNPNQKRFTYAFRLRTLPNRPPAFATVPNLEVGEGKAYAYAARADDPDGDALTYTLLAKPNGMTVDGATGQLSWAPPAGSAGRYSVAIQAKDARGLSAVQRFELAVLPATANRPPVFAAAPAVTATVGAAYAYQPAARDPDGDPVTVTLTAGPAGATFANGVLTWTPGSDQIGNQAVTLSASDGVAGTPATTLAFTVRVDPAAGNRPPVVTSTPLAALWNGTAYAYQPAAVVRTGAAYEYQVAAADPDGDPLAYAVSSPTLTGLQVSPAGLVTWAAPGSAASGTVTVTVRDGRGGQAVQQYTLDVVTASPASVGGVVFRDDNGNGTQQAGELGLPGWTVFVDRDRDGRRSAGEWAAVTDAAGAYTVAGVVPGSGYALRAARPDGPSFALPAGGSLTVNLSAGQALTGQNFAAAPTAVNRPPTLSVAPPPPLPPARVGVPYTLLATANDPDGDGLLFDLPVNPGGMAFDHATQTVTWTPTADQAGPRSALVRVRDGYGGVALVPVEVTVLPGTAPVIVSSPLTDAVPAGSPATVWVEAGLTFRYQLRALDPDAAVGDTLAYTKEGSTPAWVTVDPATGVVTAAPPGPGTYPVTLKATNGGGLFDAQTFTLDARTAPADRSPVVVSTPRTVTAAGQQYLYPVTALDPDGNPVTLSLVSPPAGMTLSEAGVVSWTPTQVGDYTVKVKVTDGHFQAFDPLRPRPEQEREYQHTQTFTLSVVATLPANRAPEFVTAPPRTADIGGLFRYDALAADPDDDPVAYGLVGAVPAGVVLDPATGALRWRPSAAQAGYQAVTVRATDRFGATADHPFAVLVRDGNRPPLFTSSPRATAQVGQPYEYAVRAEDPDGDAVTYTLVGTVPTGLTLVDGVLRGTPAAGTAGTYAPLVRATDARGAASDQPFILVVQPAANRPPAFTTDPVIAVSTGKTYSYPAAARDPDDGQTLSYTATATDIRDGSAVAGFTVNASGQVSWAVPAGFVATGKSAEVAVVLRATDNGSPALSAEQRYTLTVRGNQAPTLNTVANQAVTAGNPFRLDLRAEDLDGDLLTYAVALQGGGAAPAGMTVDGAGRVRWDATAKGTYALAATVTDPAGAAAGQNFTLTVSDDTTAPTVELEFLDDPARLDRPARFRVRASDDVGVTSLLLEVRPAGSGPWEAVGLDAEGVGRRTFAAAGNYEVRATATDPKPNTTAVTRTLAVVDPAVTGVPLVTLAVVPTVAGVPALATTVTAPTTAEVDAEDPDGLLRWKLEIRPADGPGGWETLREVTSGLGSKVDVSEPFDPTLRRNGLYTLRLTATDTGGNVGTATAAVKVDGRLKLGNFTLSATDLTIPVAGIPVTVGRVYDTLDADRERDFGFGWRLSLGGYGVTVDTGTAGPAFINGLPTFKDGTRVYVRRPDGGVDGYTFTPVPAAGFLGIVTSWYPAFTPDPGVLNALALDPTPLSKIPETGEYFDYEVGGYNPVLFGNAYDVVEYGGLTHEVDATYGDQVGVRDRNGNELTFADDAITSNRGVQVTFERDARGRVVAARDPRGNAVVYRYDARGDLVGVDDRAGTTIASYAYRAAAPLHYLTTVTDADGTRAVQADYYTGGEGGPVQPNWKNRVKSVADADGTAATFGYDVSARTQSVTTPHPAGGAGSTAATQTTSDAWGNPTEVKAGMVSGGPATSTTQMGYADLDKQVRGLPTTVRQVAGTGVPADDPVTTAAYDASGNFRSTTDPLGKTSYMTYGPNGEVLTVRDPNGDGPTNTYDDKGNLTQTMSAAGVTTRFEYDSRGLVTRTTAGAAVSRMQYDPVGRLTKATTVVGTTDVDTTYGYDPNGNQTGSSFTWVNPDPPYQSVPLATAATFDRNDRAVASTDQRGKTSTTGYDRQGRAVLSTDPRGQVSQTVYDRRGLVVESRSPDGTVTRTAYDALGRAEWATDPFVPGTPTRGTKTVYDEQGRVKATERYADVVIDVVTVAGFPRAIFVGSAATPLGTSATTFDQLGRVTQTAATGSATSIPFYDKAGRVTRSETRDPANGNALMGWSETEYDDAGRVRATAVPAAVTPLTPDGRAVTRYAYDADGRQTRVTFADGATAQTGYDLRGRRSFEVDPAGQRTDYAYDAQDRLTAVTQPAVPDPLNGNTPTRPVTQYGYDAYGNQRTITDARGRVTAFTFDAFGQQLTRTLPAVAGEPAAVETKAYDSYGNPDYALDFKGQKTDWVYDYDIAGDTDLGRLRRVDYYPAGSPTPAESVVYSYDALGRQDSVTETAAGQPDRVTNTDYDTGGRVTRASGPEGVINYRYEDGTGRLVGMWTGGGGWGTGPTQVEYLYDPLGRLKTVRELRRNDAALSPPVETTYVYDQAGAVDAVTVTQGAAPVRYTDYVYDAARGWVTRVTNKTSAAGTQLSDFQYTRRADGQVTQVVESVNQPTGGPAAVTVNYTYDALNRLVMEVADAAGTADDYTISYTLDLVGNRTTKATTKGGVTDEVRATFDARDRLLTEETWRGASRLGKIVYGYDANGSLTTRTGYGPDGTTPTGETATYSWDLRGRLAGASVTPAGGPAATTAYKYTPAGIRSRVTENGVVTRYVVDGRSPSGFAQAVEEWSDGAGGAPVLLASTVYGAGLDPLSGLRDYDGNVGNGLEVAYLLADLHSGPRQLVTAVGAVMAAYRYDAFGNNAAALAGAWAAANPNRYRGERLDRVTGWSDNRRRPYDMQTGRFPGVDPLVGTYADPLQLMRYGYAGGNPVMNGDPSGMFLVSTVVNISVSRAGYSAWYTTAITAGVAAMETALVGVGISGWALSNIAADARPTGLAVKLGISRAARGVEFGGEVTLYFDFSRRTFYLAGGFAINSSPTSWYKNHRGWAYQSLIGLAFNVTNPADDIGGADVSATWPARVFARFIQSRWARGYFPTKLAGVYGFNSYLQNLANYELNAGRGGRGYPASRPGVVQLQQSLGSSAAILLGGWRGYEFSAGISYSGAIELASLAAKGGDDVAAAGAEIKDLLTQKADAIASGVVQFDTIQEDIDRILTRWDGA